MNAAAPDATGGPCWIGPADAPRAAWLHVPDGARRNLAVVICPPHGYEAICTARALRHLGLRCAVAGLPALRFSYHGTGDSDGDDRAPARVATWLDDVGLAIDAVKERTGVERVVLVGVRLGATLATIAAATRDDVDGVVMVAPVSSGKAFGRELRAFRRLADADVHAPPGTYLHRRDIDEEVAGYFVAAETMAGLATLDLLTITIGPARALIIARDDITGGEQKLCDHLNDIGTIATVATLPGYAAMNQDPHKTEIPTEIWDATLAFATERAGAPSVTTPVTPCWPGLPATMHGEHHHLVRERVVQLGTRRAVAVVTSPINVPDDGPRVLWLNAGAIGRVGPNRMHVHLARRWAGLGATTIRIDLPGFGDSPVSASGREQVLYDRELVADVLDVVNGIDAELGPRPLVIAGLCSGAFAAFWSAVAAVAQPKGQSSIAGVVLINPQTFHFRDGDSLDVVGREAFKQTRYYKKRLVQAEAWKRVLRGDVPLRRIGNAFLQRAKDVAQTRAQALALRLGRGTPDAVELTRSLRALANRNVPVVFVYSADDPGLDNLEGKLGQRLAFLGTPSEQEVGWNIISGPDHTFTPLWAQAALAEVLDREVFARWSRRGRAGS